MTTPEDPLVRAGQWLAQCEANKGNSGFVTVVEVLIRDLLQEVRDLRASQKKLTIERDEAKAQFDRHVEWAAAEAHQEAHHGIVTATVSELRDGEENDGPLQSHDLFIEGRGISLLVNVPAGSVATYSLSVDKQRQQSGTIGEAHREAQRVALRKELDVLDAIACHDSQYDRGMRCATDHVRDWLDALSVQSTRQPNDDNDKDVTRVAECTCPLGGRRGTVNGCAAHGGDW